MAFFRKAGYILGRNVSTHISQEISSSRQSMFQAIRCMSSSKLFIGGLSYNTDDTSLTEAFSKYGEVAEARVIVDRDTGRSRGFGFVTYASIDDASAAIQALDQQELHGRRVRVNYANDSTRGYGGGGFRGGNFGGGGGGGGGYSSGGYGGNYGTGGGYDNTNGYGGNYGGGGYGRSGGGYGGSGDGGYVGVENVNSGVSSYGSGDGGYVGVENVNSGVSSYGGGNMNYGGDSQNFGVAGGAGGSDAGGSYANTAYEGFGDKFGSEKSNQMGGGEEGYSQDDPLEGNYRDDDDTPGDYADRRG